MSSKSRTGALVAKTKRHLCTNTFTGIFSWVLALKSRSVRVYPGDSGLPEDSGLIPDTPGHKASMAIFWVMGYKSPLHPFIYSSPCHFRAELLQTTFTPPLSPFGSKLVRFVVGVKRI
jgi:hypothetical protein